MSWTDYPALGERCYFLTLPNGLAVRVLPKPGFAEKFAFLGTNFGSDDVCFTWNGERHTVPDGTAHFLEHRMFSLPDCDPEDAFSRLGAQVNAFTDYAMTGYYFSCTEHFDDCLRLLLRMVMTPDFPREAMASEREVIADEIALYADSPADCAQERLYRALYRRHPIRTPITGTRTSIRRVTPEVLQLCFDAFYRPDNMALIVMGDVDAERVAELARACTPEASSGKVLREPFLQEDPGVFCRRTVRHAAVSLPSFSIGFRAEPGEDLIRQAAVGTLAAELLLGESSALYETLYEASLIDADFSACFTQVPGAALLQAGGTGRRPDAVLAAILRGAEQALAQGFDPRRFARLQKSACGRLIRELDGSESTCYRICEAYFAGAGCFDELAALQAVTLREAESFLRRTVTPARAAISIVCPGK